jgi:hypothetical protein
MKTAPGIDIELIKDWFDRPSPEEMERVDAEIANRDRQPESPPLSVYALGHLALFHAFEGKRERALEMIDELAGRPDLGSWDHDAIMIVYQAAGVLDKSKRALVANTYRRGHSIITPENACFGAEVEESVAEYVAQAIIELIDTAPTRKEALVGLAEWLCLAENNDEKVYNRLVIPLPLIVELLRFDPNEWIMGHEIMALVQKRAPDLLPHLVKYGEQIWYCGPSLADTDQHKNRAILKDVGFTEQAAGPALDETARRWCIYEKSWSYKAKLINAVGTWAHTCVRPKAMRNNEDEGDLFEFIWFGRLHEKFGSLSRACELYKEAFFAHAPNSTTCTRSMLDYYTLLLKFQDIEFVWAEYKTVQLHYYPDQPYYLDLKLLFARKFIEKGCMRTAKEILDDLLGETITVNFREKAKEVIGLMALCVDDAELRKTMNDWHKQLATEDGATLGR